ncbi:rhombosortase [Aestuariispira insulae]|uniref:Rhomboid family GlyGly-CTERM serine protease n=1 Tax=Aestuariispira insulae TaxID=1461337 RepID=A0A3D9HHN3_9PROT|nr:rhombosortase [Aestuariispira insulae]RED49029.1 rhomboid family GlyGly-CTERM serine protease [Aestuariispira insulae]
MTGWIMAGEENRGGLTPPWFTLGGLAVLLALAGVAGFVPEIFTYHREAIVGGEYWRLVTGHLVHLDPQHLLWNGLAFVLIGLFLEMIARCRAALLALVSAVLMVVLDGYLWLGRPDIAYYCGLSAILNGLLAFCLVALRDVLDRRICWLFALGALFKIGYEMLSTNSLVMDLAWPAMPDAHLAGFLAGGVLGLIWAALSSIWAEFRILVPAGRGKDAA